MSITTFTYSEDLDGAATTEVRIKTDSDKLEDIVEDFSRFLLACGFGAKSIDEHIMNTG